ncbi:MAG: flavodoxin domain-containing protein [Chloroflexota bacterium]
MKILVTAASRHGAAIEVADAIADQLSARGHTVITLPADRVGSAAGFDAVVIGSGVYMGRWLAPARSLVERDAAELQQRPVWLFSVGPLGDPPKPAEEPIDAAPMRQASGARDHRTFPGALTRADLGLREKAILRVVGAPEGDFRPWEAIRSWADEINASLPPTTVAR